MAQVHLIVCERSSRWAVSLRWAMAAESWSRAWRVIEARSLDECWEQLRAAPASLLAVEARAWAATQLLERLRLLPVSLPEAGLIVLGISAKGPEAWLWRELGAVHIAPTPRSADAILRVMRRQMVLRPPVEPDNGNPVRRRLLCPSAANHSAGEQEDRTRSQRNSINRREER